MPLTKGLRDEENERINNILKRLVGLDYIPENGNSELDEILKSLALNTESLSQFSTEAIIKHLEKLHFDFANAEKFADFLVLLSEKLPENKVDLSEKAVAIYNYIQSESKTFSFDIFNKIAAVKR
ncbi:hypothetical protein [Flavobacterium sp. 3HN19-14]|uniref:hypothetical protein n=1 Tax=Flavobacterium sp. 3HN19-14 TaxID=3448133 RepID=UPI003EE08B79